MTDYEIIWPDGFADRREAETPDKGWLGVLVRANGRSHRLVFYDLARAAQEVNAGDGVLAETGLVLLAEVSRTSVERAVEECALNGFFGPHHIWDAPARCFACGRRSDEVPGGPTASEAHQAWRWSAGVLEVEGNEGGWRAAVACWVCFWKTDPDLWISQTCWEALSPVVPFEKLPPLRDDGADREDPSKYEWPIGELPCFCCKVIGQGAIDQPPVICGKPAVRWYRHGEDVCSYCEEHPSVCGEPILVG